MANEDTKAKPKSLLGMVGRLTKKQTDRAYFSNIPVGTKFIIVAENLNMNSYDVTGYFLNYPPQKSFTSGFCYTGYIEIGSWELVGEVKDIIDELKWLGRP